MAGQSRRFYQSGYTIPKYMLRAHGHTLFYLSLKSFKAYFNSNKFLFIARDKENVKDFIISEAKKLKIKKFEVILIEKETQGQAETVFLGLKKAKISGKTQIGIFNIDTIRPNFEIPNNLDQKKTDGFLEVFKGRGKNWSYVLQKDSSTDIVLKTSEKVPISNLCCTGFYHFRSVKLYKKTFYKYFEKFKKNKKKFKELYIAPMYNIIIKEKGIIRFSLINKKNVFFCGVPKEYRSFIKKNMKTKLGIP